MFHTILCASIAVLGLGADEKPQDQNQVIADLNRQLEDAKTQVHDLAEENKKLETAVKDEKSRMQMQLVALEQAKEIALAERNKMHELLATEEANIRRFAKANDETAKRLDALQKAIDDSSKEIKAAIEERDDVMKKLIHMSHEAIDREARYDRLAKAVREKRFDDALKLVEEKKPVK